MEDLLAQIGAQLRPETLGDYFVYLLIILNFVVLTLTPEKNDYANYLILLVLFCCVIDLMRGSNGAIMPIEGFDNYGFGTMLLHIIMGIIPFMAATAVRLRGQRKGRLSIPLAIVAGITGSLYAVFALTAPQIVYSSI
ncbi:hypothetical protein G4Y79_12615 [Phototrophicus methaneseepsis]|uniref:Uncharacterized protein n=1 Tax=Phototrophicus methaneseepsis TaxID=2710758 RepID=A0A7S8E557_9CHLR|nr:hypothetical protein [Phototrophicus methaneseepsis]QPC80556.1 hypothetical protein G4Y79_12615 [Phototrophicus methaneseepsis]